MRQWGHAVAATMVLIAALTPAARSQSRPADDLSAFRAKTAEQKVRAAVFAQKHSLPLQPNTTRIDNIEEDWFPPGPPLVYTTYLKDAVCENDVVVVGTAVKQRAFMADDDSAIFTDYAVGVEEPLRGDLAHKVPVIDTTLLVSLRGGTIQASVGSFEVRDQVPLEPHDRYVFFLKRIPKTSGYTLSAPQLVITRDYPEVRTRFPIPEELKEGRTTTQRLLADLRDAARACGAAVRVDQSLLVVDSLWAR